MFFLFCDALMGPMVELVSAGRNCRELGFVIIDRNIKVTKDKTVSLRRQ